MSSRVNYSPKYVIEFLGMSLLRNAEELLADSRFPRVYPTYLTLELRKASLYHTRDVAIRTRERIIDLAVRRGVDRDAAAQSLRVRTIRELEENGIVIAGEYQKNGDRR